MSWVTCRTPGCGNEGHPIEMQLTFVDDISGEEYTVGGVVCGACDKPITDISDTEPPHVEHR